MDLVISLLVALAAAVGPVAPPTPPPSAPTQGELTKSAIDLFRLSEPPCKQQDYRFIVTSRMVAVACDNRSFNDFAGMFRIDGEWRPGVYDTKR